MKIYDRTYEWNALDAMRQTMGDTEILEALLRALDADVACDHLDWVARQYEIPLDEKGNYGFDESEEDEDED